MQQIYRGTPMLKCNFNKVALQLYWNYTSALVFSSKFALYFQNTFPKNISERLLLNSAISALHINSRNSHHCVKSVRIRSFFWPVFSRIWTEYIDLRSKSPYTDHIRENKDQKKLRIWTFFTQCLSMRFF